MIVVFNYGSSCGLVVVVVNCNNSDQLFSCGSSNMKVLLLLENRASLKFILQVPNFPTKGMHNNNYKKNAE